MLALIIRIALHAVAGAMAWTGAISLTGQNHACIDIPLLADTLSGSLGLLVGGGSISIASFIWSRIVKRKGGVT